MDFSSSFYGKHTYQMFKRELMWTFIGLEVLHGKLYLREIVIFLCATVRNHGGIL